MRLPLIAAALAPLPAFAEPPQVVTDIAPVHSLVSQVMAGVGEPELLLQGGADPHSVALKPSQARMLERAQLVIWVGEDLAPWLARAIGGLARAETIALLEHPATSLRDFDGSGAALEEEDGHPDDDREHAEDGEDDHEAGQDSEAHDHEGTDPHAWLSPDNARAWLGAVAEELAARDPENAQTYFANAQAAIIDVTQMDAAISARLEPHAGAEIVTFHDAFGYFAATYGIDILGSVQPGDASAPSAAALSALKDLVDDHGVTCAFSEPGSDPGLLEAIEAGAGLRTGVLDPMGSTLTPGPELYGELMTGVASVIDTCLTER